MKVIDPGHVYELTGGSRLVFLKKEQTREGFVTTLDGTTNEEVVDVLLDRLRTLNAAVPCRENSLAITKFEEGLHWLNARTSRRVQQGVEGSSRPHN